MEDGSLSFVFKGHKNIIHDMDWNEKDTHLITCSSDSTVKIWNVQKQKFIEGYSL
jgi:WD40 repeat protein